MERPGHIRPASGKLGVLLPGMGAVGTTFIAGCMLARKGFAQPVGSLTQMGTIRLGKRTQVRTPPIRDLVPLAHIDDLVFGGWDLFSDDCYQAALRADVLSRDHLDSIGPELSSIRRRAGGRYLYVDERGVVSYCSQRRGSPGAQLLAYGKADLEREFYTSKGCEDTCTIACVRRASCLDGWRPYRKPSQPLRHTTGRHLGVLPTQAGDVGR